jgi:2-polyprenyl-3-methyl-5-hydroxy-6-metoxy-1,4-benzoquinol methylase
MLNRLHFISKPLITQKQPLRDVKLDTFTLRLNQTLPLAAKFGKQVLPAPAATYFNADYFNNGTQTGKSCYENYSWHPEISMPIAEALITGLGLSRESKVLEYGCAKGFLVKALRLEGVDASGIDISKDAIAEAPPEIKKHVSVYNHQGSPFKQKYDWMLALDVFEHMGDKEIIQVLKDAKVHVSNVFLSIPLASVEDKTFAIASMHDDPSHIQIRTKASWIELFKEAGWKADKAEHTFPSLKEKYTSISPEGYGFFTLSADKAWQ